MLTKVVIHRTASFSVDISDVFTTEQVTVIVATMLYHAVKGSDVSAHQVVVIGIYSAFFICQLRHSVTKESIAALVVQSPAVLVKSDDFVDIGHINDPFISYFVFVHNRTSNV
jgi:hypothetical protein